MKHFIWIIYILILIVISFYFFYSVFLFEKIEFQSISLINNYIKEETGILKSDILQNLRNYENQALDNLKKNNRYNLNNLFQTGLLVKQASEKSYIIYPYNYLFYQQKLPELSNTESFIPAKFKQIINSKFPLEQKIWFLNDFMHNTNAETEQQALLAIIDLYIKAKQYNEANALINKKDFKKWYLTIYQYAVFLLKKINIYKYLNLSTLLYKCELEFISILYQNLSIFSANDLSILLNEFKKYADKKGQFLLKSFNAIVNSIEKNSIFLKPIPNAIELNYHDRKLILLSHENKISYMILFFSDSKSFFTGLLYHTKNIQTYLNKFIQNKAFVQLKNDKYEKNNRYANDYFILPDTCLDFNPDYIKQKTIDFKKQKNSISVIFILVFAFSAFTLLILTILYKHEQDLVVQKDNFVNTVSHELRTPLTGIKACAETIQNQHMKNPFII